jgi:hypothetical protein
MNAVEEIQELHDQAMALLDEAFAARRQKDLDLMQEKFLEAFPLEEEAALRSKQENIGEPTESVLLRSAATIALNAGMYRKAEKLACLALSGDPPGLIAKELREVLEKAYLIIHEQENTLITDKTVSQVTQLT